ncbi:hypothetical protein GCM10027589_36080 [Actinocorallia lasiicapitis]
MELDREGPRPLYQQVADILRHRIESGELAPGQRMPSEQEVDDEFRVARDTSRKAIRLLRGEGLIMSISGLGSFVIDAQAEVLPQYQQIASALRDRIASGEIPVGKPIPSILQLEQEFGAARMTLSKAVKVLKDEGLVESATGKGVFVVKRPQD